MLVDPVDAEARLAAIVGRLDAGDAEAEDAADGPAAVVGDVDDDLVAEPRHSIVSSAAPVRRAVVTGVDHDRSRAAPARAARRRRPPWRSAADEHAGEPAEQLGMVGERRGAPVVRPYTSSPLRAAEPAWRDGLRTLCYLGLPSSSMGFGIADLQSMVDDEPRRRSSWPPPRSRTPSSAGDARRQAEALWIAGLAHRALGDMRSAMAEHTVARELAEPVDAASRRGSPSAWRGRSATPATSGRPSRCSRPSRTTSTTQDRAVLHNQRGRFLTAAAVSTTRSLAWTTARERRRRSGIA